jgi:hypothetical protein
VICPLGRFHIMMGAVPGVLYRTVLYRIVHTEYWEVCPDRRSGVSREHGMDGGVCCVHLSTPLESPGLGVAVVGCCCSDG